MEAGGQVFFWWIQSFIQKQSLTSVWPLTISHRGEKWDGDEVWVKIEIFSFQKRLLEHSLISLAQLPNSSHNYVCKKLFFYIVTFFFLLLHSTILFFPLNCKILQGSPKNMSWQEMKSERLLCQVSFLVVHTEMMSDRDSTLIYQTLVLDIVSLITLENFEKQCFTIPWKPKYFPLVIIIYRGGRKFVWILDSTQEEQNIKCYSDWETRTWNFSSVDKVIWRTIYLLKMCMLLWYKFATGI